ncbi:MAG: hypothetical protein H7838_10985, partial [Magnetococcus sp. DMHC-8]
MEHATPRLKTIKRSLRRLLEEANMHGQGRINLLFSLLVVAALLVVIRDADPQLSTTDQEILDWLSTLFAGLFLLEYSLRWWIASDLIDDFRYARARHQRRHQSGPWLPILFATAIFAAGH